MGMIDLCDEKNYKKYVCKKCKYNCLLFIKSDEDDIPPICQYEKEIGSEWENF